MRFASIGEIAAELGVAVATLRRWHRQGRLLPACRTLGGHRRYGADDVRPSLGLARPASGKTVCYARVQLEEIAADRLRMKPQREAKLRHSVHQNGLALARLKAKFVRIEC